MKCSNNTTTSTNPTKLQAKFSIFSLFPENFHNLPLNLNGAHLLEYGNSKHWQRATLSYSYRPRPPRMSGPRGLGPVPYVPLPRMSGPPRVINPPRIVGPPKLPAAPIARAPR